MQTKHNYNWHMRSIEGFTPTYKTGVLSDALNAIKAMVRPSVSSRGYSLKR